MMDSTGLPLLILLTLGCLSCAKDVRDHFPPCPDFQEAFGGSCYEFVVLRRPFASAQAWCEQAGGRLAFIPNEETQSFLQKHLDPEMDWWLGAASEASPHLRSQQFDAVKGPLSWLDGSDISYSNWASSPQPEAGCGHILRHSAFHWTATGNCTQEFQFVCQFESGRWIVCVGQNVTLQCAYGQVLKIEGGFYGRKTVHYCRSGLTPSPTSTKDQCSSLDVTHSLKGQCDGRQACQAAAAVISFDDPCPGLGSYLSVDYHCKDGLRLSMIKLAAVFDNITISMKWLYQPLQGNATCKLRTGDGHVIELVYTPARLERHFFHNYTFPSDFEVEVECASNDVHATAQEIITIQEPIAGVLVIKCHSGNVSLDADDCKALFGAPFQIQVELEAGTNVTYTLQHGAILLASSSVVGGITAENITVSPEMMKLLALGCHVLCLHASNRVTSPPETTELKVCVLEKLAGLQASVMAEEGQCLGSSALNIVVSLERGAPALLLFSLAGDSGSRQRLHEMNTRKHIFQITNTIQGSLEVKLRAWNVFSSLDVDVEMHHLGSCATHFIPRSDSYGRDLMNFNQEDSGPREEQVRVLRFINLVIVAEYSDSDSESGSYSSDTTYSGSGSTDSGAITLKLQGVYPEQDDDDYRDEWSCPNPCTCQGQGWLGLTHTIIRRCLPKPFEYSRYYFGVRRKDNNRLRNLRSKCITYKPPQWPPTFVELRCTQGCNPVNHRTDIKIELNSEYPMACETLLHKKRDKTTDLKNGGSEYIVPESKIIPAIINGLNIKVVAYGKDVDDVEGYTTLTILTVTTPVNPNQPGVIVNPNQPGGPVNPNQPGVTVNPNQPGVTVNPNQPGVTVNPNQPGGPVNPNQPGVTVNPNQPGVTVNPNQPGVTVNPNQPGGPVNPNQPGVTVNPNQPGVTVNPNQPGGPVNPNQPGVTVNPNQPGVTVNPNQPGVTVNPNQPGGPVNPNQPGGPVNPNQPGSPVNPNQHGVTVNPNQPGVTVNPNQPGVTVNPNQPVFFCTLSPPKGTILDVFHITCIIKSPCSGCQYCFQTDKGQHIRCSNDSEIQSVFLPHGPAISNYNLNIVATLKNGSSTNTTYIISTEVQDIEADSGSSSQKLQLARQLVNDTVAQLQKQGLLSGETLGQMFRSVSDILNSQSNEADKDARQEVREQMLNTIITALEEAPINFIKSPQEVQVTARALAGIIKKDSELSLSAQKEAASLVKKLSLRLRDLSQPVDGEDGKKEVLDASKTIVESASNILSYASDKSITDDLLGAMNHIQSALLRGTKVHEKAIVVHQGLIHVFVKRVAPANLQTDFTVPHNSSAGFSLPYLPSNIIPPDDPVDVRMLSLKKNPFSWSESGNISGVVGALSLTREDSSSIPVENLAEDIEIFLPRLLEMEVNNTLLDLRNYSTMKINITSSDTSLVLKMEPSVDPLPFKLYLGHGDYPTDTKYVAMTEMPHQGETQEEKYTWLLDAKDLKGNTGEHYLVVRPIVGPGIKSVNASLYIASIAAQCKYWNESEMDWSTYGCRVGIRTTHLVTQCLCNHLTSFGSSFFVAPNPIDLSRTAELFGTFAENPVVVCFVGALFLAYFLAVVWARRKDTQDSAKVKVTILEDNNPMDEYRYMLTISTGLRRGASTSSQVTVTLQGVDGESEPHHLTDPEKPVFERGGADIFLLTTPFSLGDLQGIRLWHDNSGAHPSWYVSRIMVQDLQTVQKWSFLCNSWLGIDMGDCMLDRIFPVATEIDLKRFSNLFFMKTTKDFSDSHLWFSVISRPPGSSFTCVQRVSCCFSLLLCTMLTSIMFFGIPTDPSEQTMDLGHFEFTLQQFMVGIQSSLIMFPVNLIIVSIFRNTRPRETSCRKSPPDVTKQENIPPNQVTPVSLMELKDISLDTIIKDVTRIALSLSKTVKSNVPLESEFGPGQKIDINTVLSVVEDFIKQHNRSNDSTASTEAKTQGSHTLILEPQPPDTSPEKIVDGVQKRSNQIQYLYRQLCHIDQELSVLGSRGFPEPDSYTEAVEKVQGMKGLLQDQLQSSSLTGLDQPARSAPEDNTNTKGKKRKCCEGGLPWWFVFVGWLLVVASSCVSGFFTMLYGLKFGKTRSISWLISMVVSFFQSLLVIQPLKVLCLAVFVALVLKKVEEDDEEELVIENNRKPGDCKMVSRDSRFYKPPPPVDIEKMRMNMIKEQKAFALIKEILTYVGFMWMLLLVAYGQRDPNAFLLTRHVRQSFSKGISDSMTLQDVFIWANTSLLKNLFGPYPGFITDGNSKLVGSARLRQVRVQKNSCRIANVMKQRVHDCNAQYSWEVEDMGSYGLGWNHSMKDNASQSRPTPWKYQTQSEIRAYPIWGYALYRGGGFVADLGPDLQNASSNLQYLFKNTWLDRYTRAIFVQFTVYNANVNLFCIVTLMLETTAIGAFQFRSELQNVSLYHSPGGLHIFVLAAEVIYFLFILYYMFLQGKLMKQQRWTYFKSKWNLLELAIIALSWSVLSLLIKRTLLGNRELTYYRNHKDQFANFHDTAMADLVLGHVIAVVVLFATIKLWHLLRLNPKLNLITATLQRAWTDISGFLLVMAIMCVAYSVACNLLYGWKLASYRTLKDAVLTVISLQLGIFNYEEVLNNSPVLGSLLIGSCIVFMTFVVLNLLISVILVAFSEEQLHHKPSEEEELVDLMLMKICGLFGIRCKDLSHNTSPEGSGGSDSAFNNDKKILNNSIDVTI